MERLIDGERRLRRELEVPSRDPRVGQNEGALALGAHYDGPGAERARAAHVGAFDDRELAAREAELAALALNRRNGREVSRHG